MSLPEEYLPILTLVGTRSHTGKYFSFVIKVWQNRFAMTKTDFYS